MNYNILSKGRSHLYELAIELQEDPGFNKLITCWPKFKFNRISQNRIESHFHLFFISHFLSKYIDIEKNILKIVCKKKNLNQTAIIDINLAGYTIDNYKKVYLDHPTTSYGYQIKQWEHEEDNTGIKIKRLQKLKALYSKENIDSIYSKSHKIIVPSLASRNSFDKSLQEKIEYIPFWFPKIDNSMFDHKVYKSTTDICYIGIICPSKGVHYLAEALQKVNFTGTLHLFGAIQYEDYKKYLMRYKSAFEINFYGHVPQEKLYIKLKEMDLAVMPSVSEGLPLSYLQALSMGVPVIASKDSSLEEVIGERYIYDTKNVDELAGYIEKFLHKKQYELLDIYQNNKYTLNNYILKWRRVLNEQ